MIKDPAAVLPIWMLLSAGVGFLAGEAYGDLVRHRKCLQQANSNLRDELQKARVCTEPLHLALKHQRGVLHDIHKHVTAVTKGLQKRPS